ncbi:MAG TPA: PfkB family carbohydrate kinase [Candidatus Binatia bacterium]|nr:PfkB family carbohydrate kinase [Candidatus Binatia bacterium]
MPKDSAKSVCVVGSVALDSLETPHGNAPDVLGGACSYFAVAANFFAPVNLVGVVGSDFPEEERRFLVETGINIEGLEEAEGKTFRWHGRYHENMNVRDTLSVALNVFEQFNPKLPESYRGSEFVFLANIQPTLQANVLSQLLSPQYVGADTMDYWIQSAPEELKTLLSQVDMLSINDSEALQLSGEGNIVKAARKILAMGPRHLIVKRGEYGALQFSADEIFAVPAFPLEEVIDPTGAGDSFAGGMIGSLAEEGEVTSRTLRRAIVYGTVVASFTVENFGLDRLKSLTREEIDRRFKQFMAITDFQS